MGRARRAIRSGVRHRHLAPVGPRVEVTLCEEANRKFFRRMVPLGVNLEDFKQAVRLANAGRFDREEKDEEHEGRIRRWIRVTTGKGDRILVRVPLVVLEPADDMLPGRVEVISLFEEHE